MNYPKCIHVSKPLEGWPVQIRWAVVSNCQGYTLERRTYNETGTLMGDYAVVCRNQQQADAFTHRGLSWKEIHAAAANYGTIDSQKRNWDAVSQLGEAISHVSFIDIVPKGAAHIEYRVKAFGPSEESDYRYSGKVRTLQHATVSDDISMYATSGELVYVPITAEAAQLFPQEINVLYDSTQLRLKGIGGRECTVISQAAGKVVFSSQKVLENVLYSGGPVSLLTFEVLKTGNIGLQLR